MARVAFRWLAAICFISALTMYGFGTFASFSAGSLTQPDPVSGRTYHVTIPNRLPHDDTYVKPWVGETYDALKDIAIGSFTTLILLFLAMKLTARPVKP